MKYLFILLVVFNSRAKSQLVARILHRAGSGEAINMYEQIPPTNPNGKLAAAYIWLHGQGERGTPGDTTTSSGLLKLKNPGTSPFALLAAMMVPHYLIPNTTDTQYIAAFAPQCATYYGTWPAFYDSAVLKYIKATYYTVIDTNKIALMGHSQGGGGCWTTIADSGNATQHSVIYPCSPGYFPSTLPGAGYANAARWAPRIKNFHCADDPTAAVSLSDNMITSVNAATNYGNRGPLCPINYIRFSTGGHNITFQVFPFVPTGLSYPMTNGNSWVFNMSLYQESLQYSTFPKRRPLNF